MGNTRAFQSATSQGRQTTTPAASTAPRGPVPAEDRSTEEQRSAGARPQSHRVQEIPPGLAASISTPSSLQQRARIDPSQLSHADVLFLQRTVGNQAVTRMFSQRSSPSPQPGAGPSAHDTQETDQTPNAALAENKTGLPGSLKAGVEHLSGLALDDVRVHYNSPKPTQLQALAYTQGSEIYIRPGQEQHLAHEAWHVVQQKQRRVQPTMQLKNVMLNGDEGLEREADGMGRRAGEIGQGLLAQKGKNINHREESEPAAASYQASVSSSSATSSNASPTAESVLVIQRRPVNYQTRGYRDSRDEEAKHILTEDGRDVYKLGSLILYYDKKYDQYTTDNNQYWDPVTGKLFTIDDNDAWIYYDRKGRKYNYTKIKGEYYYEAEYPVNEDSESESEEEEEEQPGYEEEEEEEIKKPTHKRKSKGFEEEEEEQPGYEEEEEEEIKKPTRKRIAKRYESDEEKEEKERLRNEDSESDEEKKPTRKRIAKRYESDEEKEEKERLRNEDSESDEEKKPTQKRKSEKKEAYFVKKEKQEEKEEKKKPRSRNIDELIRDQFDIYEAQKVYYFNPKGVEPSEKGHRGNDESKATFVGMISWGEKSHKFLTFDISKPSDDKKYKGIGYAMVYHVLTKHNQYPNVRIEAFQTKQDNQSLLNWYYKIGFDRNLEGDLSYIRETCKRFYMELH